MSCLPESGGCERHRTDPFVFHLNAVRGTAYAHKACLDRIHRNSAQPEALYADQRGMELVIERKSVVWPADYAARHRNDHIIAESIAESLRETAGRLPISIQLEPAALMPRERLIRFAQEVSARIKASLPDLVAGYTIGSAEPGHSWTCSLDPAERAFADEPADGLIVSWVSRDQIVSSNELPIGLKSAIFRALSETAGKFSGYPDAKGILLLQPYGCISSTTSDWWVKTLRTFAVPDEISEVWLATYDWVTDALQDWTFVQVHPPREGGY